MRELRGWVLESEGVRANNRNIAALPKLISDLAEVNLEDVQNKLGLQDAAQVQALEDVMLQVEKLQSFDHLEKKHYSIDSIRLMSALEKLKQFFNDLKSSTSDGSDAFVIQKCKALKSLIDNLNASLTYYPTYRLRRKERIRSALIVVGLVTALVAAAVGCLYGITVWLPMVTSTFVLMAICSVPFLASIGAGITAPFENYKKQMLALANPILHVIQSNEYLIKLSRLLASHFAIVGDFGLSKADVNQSVGYTKLENNRVAKLAALKLDLQHVEQEKSAIVSLIAGVEVELNDPVIKNQKNLRQISQRQGTAVGADCATLEGLEGKLRNLRDIQGTIQSKEHALNRVTAKLVNQVEYMEYKVGKAKKNMPKAASIEKDPKRFSDRQREDLLPAPKSYKYNYSQSMSILWINDTLGAVKATCSEKNINKTFRRI